MTLSWVILFIVCQQSSSKTSDVKVYVEIKGMTSYGGTIPADILPTSQCLDIFLYSEYTKRTILLNSRFVLKQNIPQAHELKQSKCAGLLSDLNRRGSKQLIYFKIRSHSLITKEDSSHICSIFRFKTTSFKSKVVKDIYKLALLGSYAIWNSRKEHTWDNISSLKLQYLFAFYCIFHFVLDLDV